MDLNRTSHRALLLLPPVAVMIVAAILGGTVITIHIAYSITIYLIALVYLIVAIIKVLKFDNKNYDIE